MKKILIISMVLVALNIFNFALASGDYTTGDLSIDGYIQHLEQLNANLKADNAILSAKVAELQSVIDQQKQTQPINSHKWFGIILAFLIIVSISFVSLKYKQS